MSTPRYRLGMGRPGRDLSPAATRTLHIAFPQELFDTLVDDCQWTDVGMALSASHRATVSDYVRAAVTVFTALLASGTRERVLAFANLPEKRMADVIAHIEFVYATLPPGPDEARIVGGTSEVHPGIDPVRHGEMYRRQEGVEEKPDPGKAPLTEKDPWNQL